MQAVMVLLQVHTMEQVEVEEQGQLEALEPVQMAELVEQEYYQQ
jgi:hypothetical protein